MRIHLKDDLSGLFGYNFYTATIDSFQNVKPSELPKQDNRDVILAISSRRVRVLSLEYVDLSNNC